MAIVSQTSQLVMIGQVGFSPSPVARGGRVDGRQDSPAIRQAAWRSVIMLTVAAVTPALVRASRDGQCSPTCTAYLVGWNGGGRWGGGGGEGQGRGGERLRGYVCVKGEWGTADFENEVASFSLKQGATLHYPLLHSKLERDGRRGGYGEGGGGRGSPKDNSFKALTQFVLELNFSFRSFSLSVFAPPPPPLFYPICLTTLSLSLSTILHTHAVKH